MGRGRGPAARERRRQAAAARQGTSTVVPVAQPGDDTLFDVDFGRLRRVGIDLQLQRLITPTELAWIMHALQHRLVPIVADDAGRWMRQQDFNPYCDPANSDALFRVTFTEMCDWGRLGFCQTHHITTPITDATHAIEGFTLDDRGRRNGGGVLAWCLPDEDHAGLLAYLKRCRHVSGARLVQREDLLV